MWANALPEKDAAEQERAKDYQEASTQMSTMEDIPADGHQKKHVVDDQMQQVCRKEYEHKEEASFSWI